MSLNRVLNRPLFRQQALRKGALKPIKASNGNFVMNPTPTSFQTASNFRPPMNVPQPGMFSRAGQFMKRMGSDVRNFPSTAVQQVTKPRVRVPFGMGGGLGGLLGYEGLYSGVSGLTTKLGMQPGMAKNVVDFGLTTAGMFNPYTRALGLGITGLKAARALGSPVIDYFGQERGLKPGDTRKALTVDLGKPLFSDVFKPRNLEEIAKQIYKKEEKDSPMQIASGRGAGNYDSLTQPENETQVGNNTVVDLNKVVKNVSFGETPDSQGPMPSGIDGGLTGPVGAEPGAPMGAKPPAPVKEPKPLQKAQQIFNQSQQGKGTEKPIGGKLYTKDLIDRAKQIRSELGMDPQGDLARTTFLSSLAAGLMAGTTRKSGLGGALEVLGNALGPAVNNYAVMKLKQNELENKSMETYLGFALDEMKLFNEAAAGEPFDGQLGVVQFIDENGNTINVKGRQTKGGTIEFATGQIGPRGNEVYASISSQATVPGFGKVNQFLDKKTVDQETIKIGDTLSNRYKTFKITNDVLDTIAAQPESVGPAGAINLLKTRLGSALSDLGFSFGGSKDQARATAEAYRSQIESSDLDEATKKRLLKSTDFNKIYKEAEKRIKARTPGKVDAETLESLAVAETTLVYALANSFKDKDRLTARDVAAAEKLVNLFTLTRGSASVEASIRAIGKQLQDDIIRYENDYRRVGGLERTLQNMRVQNQFRLQEGQTVTDAFIKGLDEAGLLEEFNK